MGEMADLIIDSFIDYDEYVIKDPLRYHKKLKNVKFLSENRAFYIVEIDHEGVPIQLNLPKKICRNVEKKKGKLYVHRKIFNEILYREFDEFD